MAKEINQLLDKLVDDIKCGFNNLFSIIEESDLELDDDQKRKLFSAREIYRDYFGT